MWRWDFGLLSEFKVYLCHCSEAALHIESETKWSPFCRRHFQVHFVEWKLLNFNHNFPEICSSGCNWQYGSIGSDNGLAPNRRQAIIRINDGLGYWCIYTSFGSQGVTLLYDMPCYNGTHYTRTTDLSIWFIYLFQQKFMKKSNSTKLCPKTFYYSLSPSFSFPINIRILFHIHSSYFCNIILKQDGVGTPKNPRPP